MRTKRHLVVKFVLDKQSLFCYAGDQHKLKVMSRHGGIPTQAKGYGVATMTVLSRAKGFGFLVLNFGRKKRPTDFSAGLNLFSDEVSIAFISFT